MRSPQNMAASSVLSSLSRTPTPSHSARHYTADGSASIPADQEDQTDISSPGEVADHDFTDVKAPFREATALPEELKQLCQIQMEEQTCKQRSGLSRSSRPVNNRAGHV